jgi:hypothetical protein
MDMDRTLRVTGLAALFAFSTPAFADPIQAVLYKHPQCGCCETYATYLRRSDFKVDVKKTYDLAEISRKAGVPAEMEGCHTMFIDGYVIDGPCSREHRPQALVREARNRRHHASRHASRLSGYDRQKDGEVYDLRRHQGRQCPIRVCHRVIQ